jgi:hypothetical protein
MYLFLSVYGFTAQLNWRSTGAVARQLEAFGGEPAQDCLPRPLGGSGVVTPGSLLDRIAEAARYP